MNCKDRKRRRINIEIKKVAILIKKYTTLLDKIGQYTNHSSYYSTATFYMTQEGRKALVLLKSILNIVGTKKKNKLN